MRISRNVTLAILATVVIVAISILVVYYANTLSTITPASAIETPTIIIVPVAEHGVPDVLNLVFYYCAINRSYSPYKTLMLLFNNYRFNGSVTYYPDILKLSSRVLKISFVKDCLGISNNSNITVSYVYLKGSNLYATILNCSDKFFKQCMEANHNETYCMHKCVELTYDLVRTNEYLFKSSMSAISWMIVNKMISEQILSRLGTPEIIYMYYPSANSNSVRVLVYLGLQVPPNINPLELQAALSSALEHNTVPREFAEKVRDVFFACVHAIIKGETPRYLVEFYGTVPRDRAEKILEIAREYGFTVVKGRSDLYVILFVSPTCPWCKTEILSLIEAGVLPKP